MRINKFVAQATGLSRRAADRAISEGRVQLNKETAVLGDTVGSMDTVALDGKQLETSSRMLVIINKPVSYVSSRNGQGSKTVYDLLPEQFGALKLVGRLDKDSSGLILLTNDGELANQLTHPRYAKSKVYQIELNKSLQPLHQQLITDRGIQLPDGISKFSLQKLDNDKQWEITMSEGRNRQIRRTFESLGYKVTKLNRIAFGDYKLSQLSKTQVFMIIDK